MRKWSAFGLILLFLFISAVVNAATREVQGSATGLYYNKVWNRWSEKPISVYVDDGGNFYIEGGDGLIFARGLLYFKEITKVIELLEKSLKWAETAKKEKVEITKDLGSFMKSGSYNRHGVKLTFFAVNKGQHTGVILYIVSNVRLGFCI